jgi:endo-1,4-beta-xylanase
MLYSKGKEVRRCFSLFALIIISLPGSSQIADGKCRFLGNIISASTPGDFTTYWNQVTPENGGKWGSVEPSRDVMNWTQLDNAYETARTNGFPFKQHTFVWGQQQPNWIGALPLAEQKEEVEEWIRLFCERYPDTDYIDVVNEPLHAVPVYDQALGTGWNWVIWAFEKARQYCPKAKLILNDYNIISSQTATESYVALINMLKEKNLIDVIGEQGHFLETTPIATITANLNRLHATGLPIHISEFDVNIANDTEQSNKYKELFPALWTHAGVQGITLWGYREGEIWRENAFLIRSSGAERPAFAWLKSYVTAAAGGTFCLVTGTDNDMTTTGVSFYPNPSTDGIFNVMSKSDADIVIMTMHGVKLHQEKAIADREVNIKLNAGPGPYIIKVVTMTHTSFHKVIVH